jgi:DNA-binding beta-propeller fold protein YncE
LTVQAAFTVNSSAQEKLPLKLVSTTPLPGFTGDLDHFGLDLKGNRLFLAAEDKKTVEVFDLRTGERIHSIEGLGHPLTMAYLPQSNQLIVTNGDTNDVALVDCKEYKIINTLALLTSSRKVSDASGGTD